MSSRWRCWAWAIALMSGVSGSVGLCDPAPLEPSMIAPFDLKAPFDARSPWRLEITQGPPTEDYGGDPAPGRLDLCLQKSPAGPCERKPVSADPAADGGSASDWGPHYLRSVKPVYPRGRSGPPLLQLVTASLHAGDGGQVVVTQLLKYDKNRDAFERIYVFSTGTNNNQEVRFIDRGPLIGDVISAEPTTNAPYDYRMTVNRFTPTRTYRQVLRYRSATRYQDGDTLAVIDSEMPNIQRRLGLWRPGLPPPLPASAAKTCLKPRLVNMELWCR